jgi:dissimilatory sulfite reductase (desulfoviridin) alpha/beta subunit
MSQVLIDYDDLKKRGFLRQKQDGLFVLRTRMPSSGVYTETVLKKLADISKKYAIGTVHATVRQGLEIPFIKFEDIPKVEADLAGAGIDTGTSGPRLRATTVCPGNNWCKQGLVNTFYLAGRIEGEVGLKCGLDLPHKFKIAISGCPNGCTRPQASDIGVHGQVDATSPERRVGYAVYIGGNGGRMPKTGIKLDKVLTEDEVLDAIKKVVLYYKKNAKPRQRLFALIEEVGAKKFLLDIS